MTVSQIIADLWHHSAYDVTRIAITAHMISAWKMRYFLIALFTFIFVLWKLVNRK